MNDRVHFGTDGQTFFVTSEPGVAHTLLQRAGFTTTIAVLISSDVADFVCSWTEDGYRFNVQSEGAKLWFAMNAEQFKFDVLFHDVY